MALSKKPSPPTRKSPNPDDFASVAKRLECDEDKAVFEKKLGKIAKTKIITKMTHVKGVC
jgi:hypothetical protein